MDQIRKYASLSQMSERAENMSPHTIDQGNLRGTQDNIDFSYCSELHTITGWCDAIAEGIPRFDTGRRAINLS